MNNVIKYFYHNFEFCNLFYCINFFAIYLYLSKIGILYDINI